jgi:predicted acetyltransferase
MGVEQEIWNNTYDRHTCPDIFVIQMSFHVNNTGTMQNIKTYFVEQKIQVRSITGISVEKGFKNKGITQQLH